MKVLTISTIVSLSLVFNCIAANRYVNPNATGANNGISWADGWESFANINWNYISPGDTIFISGGTSTNTYSGNLDVQASGTSGNPIVVMCGQSAGHNGQVIMSGLRITGRDYVTVTGIGASDTFNIRVTGNSTHNVIITRTEGVIIEGCEIDNSGSVCVEILEYIDGGNVIRYNKIHDAGFHSVRPNRPPGDGNYGFSNYEHLIIEHNEIYNLGEDGIHCQAYAGGLTVRYNHVHTQLTGVARYVDGIQARGVMWLKIHNNLFRELWSPDGVNGSIYIESDWATQSNEHAHDIQIYNNIIWEHQAGGYARGISFASREATTLTNILIANNTIVDSYAWGIQLQLFDVPAANITNFFVFNNIVHNCYQRDSGSNRNVYSISGVGTGVTIGSYGDGTDIEWDYNVSSLSSADPLRISYDDMFYNYSSWKSTFGTDDNGNSTVPLFFDYREQNMQSASGLYLQSGDNAAIDNGVDLSSFFTIDYRGVTRSGTWDIGAFETVITNGRPKEPQNLEIEVIDD